MTHISKACVCTVLTLWILASCCCFIAMSVVYLKPFLKAVRYKQTVCHVENSFYSTQFLCPCQAGPSGSKYHCPTYPCLLVHVSLNTSSHRLVVVPLFVDDVQQAAVTDSDADQVELCTLHVCSGNSLWNRDRVDNFSREMTSSGLSQRRRVNCLYDPWDVKSGAVLKATVHGWPVFHAIFWPFVCAGVGILVCALFCRHCHRHVQPRTAATPTDVMHAASDDVTSYAVAARALLNAQKRRKHRSIRNLWMMQQNI